VALINDLPFENISRDKFLLVRTICDSIKMVSLCTIIEDCQNFPFRVTIYNSSYNFIPKDSWVVIKEPLKKLANDGNNVIRLDNPDDIEFIDKTEMEH
jgi:hypothetical protein